MKFTIKVFEEQSGNVIINAKTKEQAELMANEILNNEGIEGFKDFDIKYREVLILK